MRVNSSLLTANPLGRFVGAFCLLMIGSAVAGERINAELSFPDAPEFLKCGRTLALKPTIRQQSGDWLVIEGDEFSRFVPANENGRLVASDGAICPRVVMHASELKYVFWLVEAGFYDVWIHAKFPRKGFYNHSESMDHGTPRVIRDSEDPAAPGQWLPPDTWHWVRTTTYNLVRGPHHWFWLPPGAWCAGCELDRIVLVKSGSKVTPQSATKSNRTVERATEGVLQAKRIRLGRVRSWRFDPVFDRGDGDIAFECSKDGENWKPMPLGKIVRSANEDCLYVRIRMVAAPEGKRQPIVYDYSFSIERKERRAEPEPAVPAPVSGVVPLRIIPNKIVYPVGETGTVEVVVKNLESRISTAALLVEERWGLEERGRELYRGKVSLEPDEVKSLTIPYPGSTVRYGHEVRVKIGERSRSEFFNVIDEWWRVNQGGYLTIAEGGGISPALKHLLDYYGYTTNDWRRPAGMFAFNHWESRMPGMGPFMGYNNMETRWQMERSSCGGNSVILDYPDSVTWPNIQHQGRRTGDIRKDTEITHSRGYHHTRYTIGFMEGSHGLELARKYPEFIRRNGRGCFEGLYATDVRVNPVVLAKDGTFDSTPWTYVEPNFFNEEAFNWAIDDLVNCISGIGEDGIYFDGRYMQHTGFDAFGTNLGKQPAADAAIIRNMKAALAKIHRANPKAYVWSNGCTAENPELSLADHPQTGLLKETQWPFLLNPSRPDHSYRGFMNGLVRFRDSMWRGGKYVKRPSKILHCGYLMTNWDGKKSIAYRESWTMASHVMSIIAAICAHPFAYPPPCRPFKQMMTRYSDCFWHEDLEIVPDARAVFTVDSLREIWYADTVYRRETPDFEQYAVHLVNAPENEFCDETVTDDPPEADDVEVSTKLFGEGDLRAWAIRPYGYLADRVEPSCVPVGIARKDGEAVFSVPPFKYYALLVIWKKK